MSCIVHYLHFCFFHVTEVIQSKKILSVITRIHILNYEKRGSGRCVMDHVRMNIDQIGFVLIKRNFDSTETLEFPLKLLCSYTNQLFVN